MRRAISTRIHSNIRGASFITDPSRIYFNDLHPNHISKSAIAALTLPMAPSAICSSTLTPFFLLGTPAGFFGGE